MCNWVVYLIPEDHSPACFLCLTKRTAICTSVCSGTLCHSEQSEEFEILLIFDCGLMNSPRQTLVFRLVPVRPGLRRIPISVSRITTVNRFLTRR